MDAKQLINIISDKNFLTDFLNKHNIAQVEQLQVVNHYVQGENRASIIVSKPYMKNFWESEGDFVQKYYDADKVQYLEVPGQLTCLKIKYSDRPFSWLYTAGPQEIQDYANEISDDAKTFRNFITETFDNIFPL